MNQSIPVDNDEFFHENIPDFASESLYQKAVV